ncbi:hypothetical protein [Clostridium taeniosporum]|uniref:Uncharacterized protein n=1 Tax=Clostridium taeniosporum TaxID=394958 RepID=A0A1D7XJ42_9CLOT|nr:hypothetical protein [Clostridium taeniosporum]AOR23345.1 hypothetical protein BGI42_06175 [Clostridium taeniosporum]
MDSDLIINIGLYGSKNKNLQIGQTFLYNKIIDNDTKRTYYTDILFKHTLKKEVLKHVQNNLTHFSNSLLDESRKYGVKIITIHPDIAKTNFYRNANFKEGNLLDTYITPDEVANAVDMTLKARDRLVITDITLRTQKTKFKEKNKSKSIMMKITS